MSPQSTPQLAVDTEFLDSAAKDNIKLKNNGQSNSSVITLASVARCNFPCNLSGTVGKNNPLQITADMLHVAILVVTCNDFKKSLQWWRKVDPIYLLRSLRARKSCEISCCDMLHTASYLEMVQQRGCNASSIFQHWLQVKAKKLTSKINLRLTFSSDCKRANIA